MSQSTPPVICGLVLAAVSAASFSHWWSVEELVRSHSAPPRPSVTLPSPVQPAPAAVPAATPELPPAPPVAPDPSPSREKFYETLLAEIRELRSQNRDLRDQIAETNRDVMKLEFRVDTHSESFRPLPISEERFDTSFGTGYDGSPGVLPPRAEEIYLEE